jgi:hypothetical protein
MRRTLILLALAGVACEQNENAADTLQSNGQNTLQIKGQKMPSAAEATKAQKAIGPIDVQAQKAVNGVQANKAIGPIDVQAQKAVNGVQANKAIGPIDIKGKQMPVPSP